MTVTLNKAGERNAHALIEGGHYDADSAWSFDADDGDKLLGSEGKDWTNYAQWFLGEDTDATAETKDRYKYPFGKEGKVYRGALNAIRQRASQQDVTGIYDAAGRLLDALDVKTGKKAKDDEPRNAQIGIARRAMDVQMEPASLDDNDRTVDAVLSTGAAVRRSDWQNGDYDEVLDMKPASIRMDRLNQGAPLLDSHDYWGGTQSILGSVVPGSARIDGGQLKAKFKFSRSQNGDRAYQDVKDGVLRHVSVGYLTHKFSVDDTKTPAVRTATDWEPYECSAVAMPADPGAGFRANEEHLNNRALPANTGDRSMTIKIDPAGDKSAMLDDNTRAQVNAAVIEGVRAGILAEGARRTGIEGVGRQLNLSDEFVRTHVGSETTLDKFRELAITEAKRVADTAPTNSYNLHGTGPAVITDPKREVQKGEMAARMIRCYAGAKRNSMSPVDYARNVFKDDLIARAMSSGLEASGGAWVPEQWAAEIIELLRPQAVVRSSGPVIMPMPNGNMTVPRINSGSNAHYVGENTDITSGDLGTGDVKLSAKKLAAIVPISNDLIRFSSYAADQVVRDDIVAAVAVAEDVAFIRGGGTAFTPKGMRNWAPSANVINATAGQSQANVITDTNKLLNALQGANVRMIRPTWMMSYRSYNYLNSVTTTTGAFVWRDELNAGKFRGYPYKATNNIPNNLSTGVGSESELYLADFADCVIGEVPGFMIDVSQDAVYTADGTNLISAFSRDQTVIRVMEQHDFAMRHDFSVAVLAQVTWA